MKGLNVHLGEGVSGVKRGGGGVGMGDGGEEGCEKLRDGRKGE